MKDWKKWWRAAGVRAIRTVSQTALSMLPVAVTITEVNWKIVVGTALLSGAISLLESLTGLPEVEESK